MIVGLGVDITEVDRIEAAIERRGRPFLERLFTPSEIAYCETHRHRAERFAGRFAAKEAAMKALGTGWARGVRWVDIEVTRDCRLPRRQEHRAHHHAHRKYCSGVGHFRIVVSRGRFNTENAEVTE